MGVRSVVRKLGRYGAVGGCAAVFYYATVIGLVELGGLRPLAANPMAFLLAVVANYTGQRLWTFPESTRAHRSSLPRFLATAALGFSLNQSLFYLLLNLTDLPYVIALPVAAGLVAGVTFTLALLWVFRRERRPAEPLNQIAGPTPRSPGQEPAQVIG